MKTVFAKLATDFLSTIVFVAVYFITDNVLLATGVAIAMLVAFLLLSSESYLATYTLSCFQLSQGIFGPTEIRLLLIAGNLALLHSPYSTLFGHKMLLFDLGGAIAAVCMFTTAIVITIRHTAELYREEPLP